MHARTCPGPVAEPSDGSGTEEFRPGTTFRAYACSAIVGIGLWWLTLAILA